MLTANRLRDGEVVYWRDGTWVTRLDEGSVFSDKVLADDALARAAQAVADRLVVNPYLFAVRRNGISLQPVEEREVIRAAGPSVRRDLGKQASHVSL